MSEMVSVRDPEWDYIRCSSCDEQFPPEEELQHDVCPKCSVEGCLASNSDRFRDMLSKAREERQEEREERYEYAI